MAEQDRFTIEEWQALAKAPSGAFSLVFVADRFALVSMVKETFAAGQAVRAARNENDWPPVVAELIEYRDEYKKLLSASTESGESLRRARQIARDMLAEAAAVAQKLTAEELEGYLRWVLGIARRVAESAKELGSDGPISAKEAAALEEIERILRGGAPSEDDPDEDEPGADGAVPASGPAASVSADSNGTTPGATTQE